jgi:hypothetical protein
LLFRLESWCREDLQRKSKSGTRAALKCRHGRPLDRSWMASHVRACCKCETCWPVIDEDLQPPASFRGSMEIQLADSRKGIWMTSPSHLLGVMLLKGFPFSDCRPPGEAVMLTPQTMPAFPLAWARSCNCLSNSRTQCQIYKAYAGTYVRSQFYILLQTKF